MPMPSVLSMVDLPHHCSCSLGRKLDAAFWLLSSIAKKKLPKYLLSMLSYLDPLSYPQH